MSSSMEEGELISIIDSTTISPTESTTISPTPTSSTDLPCETCQKYELSLKNAQGRECKLHEELKAARSLAERYGSELIEERQYRQNLERKIMETAAQTEKQRSDSAMSLDEFSSKLQGTIDMAHSVVVVRRKRKLEDESSGENPVKKGEEKEEEGENNEIKKDQEGDALSPESLSNSNIVIDEKVRDDRLDTVVEDYFSILSLPTELISRVISFLSMEDRLRLAGVNKRLNTIELETKYYAGNVMIEERSIEEGEIKEEEDEENDEDDGYVRFEEDEKMLRIDQRITFFKEKSYSSDCIRRLAKNVSIARLRIKLVGSGEFQREIYNLIKELDIEDLDLSMDAYEHEMLKEMMEDPFFLDLARSCRTLHLHESDKITSKALYQVYSNMVASSTKLREFYTFGITMKNCIEFLSLIEIKYADGKFFTTRTIELYEWRFDNGSLFYYSIFAGCLQIDLSHGIFKGRNDAFFHLVYHETQESLEEAKDEANFVRIDVSPE